MGLVYGIQSSSQTVKDKLTKGSDITNIFFCIMTIVLISVTILVI